MRHLKTVLSLAALLVAAGLFAVAAWSRLADDARRGEWRQDFTGENVRRLAVAGLDGGSVEVRHPSILYFFRADCVYCPEAEEGFLAALDDTVLSRLRVYAITNADTSVLDDYAAGMPGAIRIVVPSGPNPQLRFVDRVPTFLRTDSAGRVVGAYVGIPNDEIVTKLVSPDRSAGGRSGPGPPEPPAASDRG